MTNSNRYKKPDDDVTAVYDKFKKPYNRTIQCVLVGDAGVGKTSLIVSYTTNGYPVEYIPTTYDKYSVDVQVDEEIVALELCDTSGKTEFDTLRHLSYETADVFLLCFNVASKQSFNRLREIWRHELRQRCRSGANNVPVILVGTKCDLRSDPQFVLIDLAKCQTGTVVNQWEAIEFAREIGPKTQFIESSALTQRNLKDTFDAAIMAGIFKSAKKNFPWKINFDPQGYSMGQNTTVIPNSKTICNCKYIECKCHQHIATLQQQQAADGALKNAWKKIVKIFS